MAYERARSVRPEFPPLFWWLLAGDCAFILIHLIHVYGGSLPNVNFSIETEGGFAERFQYVQEFGVLAMLGVLWRRTRHNFYGGWALLFGYVLLDDSLQIHETGGEILSRHLAFPSAFGLRGQDFGELAVWGMVGLGVALLIVPAYFRQAANSSTAPNTRNVCKDLGVLFAVLVFCGMGLDMAHSFVRGDTMRVFMGLVEDGGEMVVMSLICGYALNLIARNGIAPPAFGLRRWTTRAYISTLSPVQRDRRPAWGLGNAHYSRRAS